MSEEKKEVKSDFYDLEYFLRMESRYLSGAFSSLSTGVLKNLGSVEGKKVLDVGCGGGFFLKKMSDLGAGAFGCDYSLAAVNFTKKRFPFLNVFQLSAYEIDSIGEKFDLVLAINVVEHLENIDLFLKKSFFVLNPKGKLIIVTDNEEYIFNKSPFSKIRKMFYYTSFSGRAYSLIKKAERLMSKSKNYHESHLNVFSSEYLADKIEKLGFKIEKIDFFHGVSIPWFDFFLKLLFPKRFFGGDFQIIIARKD